MMDQYSYYVLVCMYRMYDRGGCMVYGAGWRMAAGVWCMVYGGVPVPVPVWRMAFK
jgi:hypothetical protein